MNTKELKVRVEDFSDCINTYVKGRVPRKSGNYAIRYNGIESRDDFTTEDYSWKNTATRDTRNEVEWNPSSFREL